MQAWSQSSRCCPRRRYSSGSRLPPALEPVAALLEMLVQTVDEERHPADPRLPGTRPAGYGCLSNTPPEISAVIAVIWSNGKLTQCTWM